MPRTSDFSARPDGILITGVATGICRTVGGLPGPIAIPFTLGLPRPFRKSGPTAALVSRAAGLFAFRLVNYPVGRAVEGGVPGGTAAAAAIPAQDGGPAPAPQPRG